MPEGLFAGVKDVARSLARRVPRLCSRPSFFQPSTTRRMERFASSGEMGEPCGCALVVLGRDGEWGTGRSTASPCMLSISNRHHAVAGLALNHEIIEDQNFRPRPRTGQERSEE